jgi:hypothetical protein
LIAEQSLFYNAVMTSISGPSASVYFLDGLAGTGKSTVFNKLTSDVTATLTTASSEIAATTLLNGRTAHSTFNIPLVVDNYLVAKPTLQMRSIIEAAELIIWDEITMASKNVVNSVDMLCREIMNVNEPFGGKIIVSVVTGDKRYQLLSGVDGQR